MKISLVSDLHLETTYQQLPGGDVLILAGDICEIRTLHKEFHSTKLLDRKPGSLKFYDFFYHECAKYNKVFYVLGNHEHYNGRLDKTHNDLRSILPENFCLLENQSQEYQGVLFVGATLWTDCNKVDPNTMWTLKSGMNDYRLISNFYADKNIYHKLTPEHTVVMHRASRKYIRECVADHPNMPVVVITHHGPTYASIHEKYQHAREMNGGYTSDLSELILDHANIKYWVHGHLHDAVDYQVGSTRVLSNPRGYVGYEDTSRFDSNFVFEI